MIQTWYLASFRAPNLGTIDGVAAPVLYVSANQVTVQVPYEVTTPAVDNVVLTNGANPQAGATVTTALTAKRYFSKP